MVVAIGAANDFMTQLSKLATTDSRGQKMLFGLKDFKNFAHVAYYFHKGKYLRISYYEHMTSSLYELVFV